mgnify:CR=1 FL=1
MYWGPLLFKCKIFPEDLKAFADICVKDKSKDNRSNLAGVIQEEYTIDNEKFSQLISRYLHTYSAAFQAFFHQDVIGGYDINAVWVNYMSAGEGNPIHIHEGCDLSSVLYIDMPKALQEEQKNFKGNGAGPGGITFYNQPNVPGYIASNVFRPETGDFFMFPALLPHSVGPYTSKCERISISANFSFKHQPKGPGGNVHKR